MNLHERVLRPLQDQARKHGFGDDYAEDCIRGLDPLELLQRISEAMCEPDANIERLTVDGKCGQMRQE